MQTIRVAILVSLLSTTGSIASARANCDINRASHCTCNGFPGNYPGIGLFKYDEKGQQVSLVRLFPAFTMAQTSLDLAMQQCKDLYKELSQNGDCSGPLLINGEY